MKPIVHLLIKILKISTTYIFWILKSLFNLSPPYISNYKRQTVINLVCCWHISQACIRNNALAIVVLTFTMGFI